MTVNLPRTVFIDSFSEGCFTVRSDTGKQGIDFDESDRKQDIVERLRDDNWPYPAPSAMELEAASEIETLREALREIVTDCRQIWTPDEFPALKSAESALAPPCPSAPGSVE